MLVYPSKEDFEVLVVKRVKNPSDPWSGEMAFPGGKRSDEDQNLKETVIRETFEETNIDLHEHCRFLGVLPPLTSTKKPHLKILPFVILLEHKPAIKLNSKELEAFVWIYLKELPRYKTIKQIDHERFPAYIIGNATIWGLTYRILENFEELGIET
jgi:8-oxo-dGTP pyrophosphatase MutT (NUDIX family)